MTESLFSRAAAVDSPTPEPEAAEAPPSAYVETPRGIALRRTTPRRTLVDSVDVNAEVTASNASSAAARLAALAEDRPTPAPRATGWRSLFGTSL